MRQGFALFAATPTEVIRACANEAESLGYTSFWLNHPGKVDGLAALANAAAVTQRIDLGVGVIPLHTRGPESIVHGVRAAALPVERLLLGVGSPNPGSLARVRSGVAQLRAQLPTTRVVVAALGPKMCTLAGEIADGVLLNWLTPEAARIATEWVRAGAQAGGRPTPTIFAYVRVAIGEAAGATLLAEGERYDAIAAYHAHFVRMGVKPVETSISVPRADQVPTALAKWEGIVDEVVVRAITASDTVEENVAVLRAARVRS